MKNNLKTKIKKGLMPAIMLVIMVLTSTCLFAQSGSKLLYQGQYKETEHRWPAGNTMMAMMEQKEILIYEDKMEVYNVYSNGTDSKPSNTLPFKYIQNGKRVYAETGSFINITAVVDGNFNISCSDSSGGSFQYKKNGSSSTTPQGGNNVGGQGNGGWNGDNNNNGGNSGNTQTHGRTAHQVTKSCPLCHGSGKCSSCNGTHRINYEFGSGTVECPNCKPNGACSKCGGNGKITTTEWY